jgi:TonB family protein
LELDSKKRKKTTSDLLKELEAVETVSALSTDTPEKEKASQSLIPDPITKKMVEVIKVRVLSVRAEPKVETGNIVYKLKKGAKTVYTGENEGWYQIEYTKGKKGWISKKYSTLLMDSASDLSLTEKLSRIEKGLAALAEQPTDHNLNGKEKVTSGLLKELETFESNGQKIEVDISQSQVSLKNFKSGIQRVKPPTLKPGLETKNIETLAPSDHKDSSGSKVLSMYIGKIYRRVYSKWKTPLGSKSKNVVVAFTIFPEGNIDKPVIREGAGDENLDSIAIRAIFDSAPFPPFPKELNRKDLRISINFKYLASAK